jgi:hypothetical protein
VRQIPSDEFCGECPCLNDYLGYCQYYPNDHLQTDDVRPGQQYFRLSQCLRDKPQVLTEADREELWRYDEHR